MTKNEVRLVEGLLSRSSSPSWDIAKLEWELAAITIGINSCICGKNPIKYICLLTNSHTNETAILGSTCVEKYLNISCDTIFKDMEKDVTNRFVKIDTLKFAYARGYVNDWEYEVYQDLQKWKKLSAKQKGLRDTINLRIKKLLVSFA
jgi:hypothetical protein